MSQLPSFDIERLLAPHAPRTNLYVANLDGRYGVRIARIGGTFPRPSPSQRRRRLVRLSRPDADRLGDRRPSSGRARARSSRPGRGTVRPPSSRTRSSWCSTSATSRRSLTTRPPWPRRAIRSRTSICEDHGSDVDAGAYKTAHRLDLRACGRRARDRRRPYRPGRDLGPRLLSDAPAGP